MNEEQELQAIADWYQEVSKNLDQDDIYNEILS